MNAEAGGLPTEHIDQGRLAAWLGVVALFSALAWGSRVGNGGGEQVDFFSWSFLANGLTGSVILLLPVVGIAYGRRDLLALRRPRAWPAALRLAVGTYVALWLISLILAAFGLSPGGDQGLLPSGWEGGHTAAFVANTVYVVAVVPPIEETLVRGVGYGLLRPLGVAPAAILTAAGWAVMHGFATGIPLLLAFGIGLALIRERTGSTIPGMVVHGLFNGFAVAVAVFS